MQTLSNSSDWDNPASPSTFRPGQSSIWCCTCQKKLWRTWWKFWNGGQTISTVCVCALISVFALICVFSYLCFLGSVFSQICVCSDLCFLRFVVALICVFSDLCLLWSVLAQACVCALRSSTNLASLKRACSCGTEWKRFDRDAIWWEGAHFLVLMQHFLQIWLETKASKQLLRS